MTYLEEQYEQARMECWLCRALGDKEGLRAAISRAWHFRCWMREADPSDNIF